jgi:thiol:disulfide interchange protein
MKRFAFALLATGALTAGTYARPQAPPSTSPPRGVDVNPSAPIKPRPTVESTGLPSGLIPVSITWQKNLVSARTAARDGQVIVVDVYTDWCRWCKVMDQSVYASPDVASFATQHVFVKFNAEDGRDGQAFARQMGVKKFPTLFVFRSDGKLLEKRVGAFKRSRDFLNWVAKARARA